MTLQKQLLIFIFVLFTVIPSIVFALPDTVTLTVDRDGVPYTFQLKRASVRTADCMIYTWDSVNGYITLDPQPEVRTYRGTVDESPNTLIVGWIDTYGNLRYSGFNPEWGKGWYWSGTVDVSDQLINPIMPIITPQITGTGSTYSTTVAAGVEAPHTYIPPAGGLVVVELALDIKRNVVVEHGLEYALGRSENEAMLYSYTMARDAMMHVQVSASCLNLEEYFPSGYSLGGLKGRWQNEVPLNHHADYVLLHGLWAGGVAWLNTAGGAWGVSLGAIYHETSHNWNATHLGYERDSQWGNRPFNGAWEIDKILARRANRINAGVLTSPEADYPWPLHPYTHPDLATVSVNGSVDINVLANDWDGNQDDLSVVNYVASCGTVIDLGNGILRYTPPADYVGKAMIVYTVQDNSLLSLRGRDIVHIEVINQDLAVHYEFEETSGDVVSDSSGVGYAGSLNGGDFSTDSIPGPVGLAVRTTSSASNSGDQGGNHNGLIVGAGSILPVPTEGGTSAQASPFDIQFNDHSGFYDPMGESYTLACWFKVEDFSSRVYIVDKQGWAESMVGYRLYAEPSGLYLNLCQFDGAKGQINVSAKTPIDECRWYHLTLVFDRSSDDIRIYLDGSLVADNTTILAAGSFIFNGRVPLRVGSSSGSRLSVDDFRIYTRSLAVTEIQDLVDLGLTPAHSPSPANGADWQLLQSDISWGDTQTDVLYDVYCGTDEFTVAAATPASTEYQGQVSESSYDLPELGSNKTYYWRVDVVDGAEIAVGDVWSFSTLPSGVVSVSLVNPGFEADLLDPAGWYPALHKGWVGTGTTGTIGEQRSSVTDTPDDAGWGHLQNAGTTLGQNIGDMSMLGKRLQVSYLVSRRTNESTATDHTVKLIAGSPGTYVGGVLLDEQSYTTPLSASNTYNEVTIELLPDGDPGANDTLWLVFENNNGGQLHIDGVSVSLFLTNTLYFENPSFEDELLDSAGWYSGKHAGWIAVGTAGTIGEDRNAVTDTPDGAGWGHLQDNGTMLGQRIGGTSLIGRELHVSYLVTRRTNEFTTTDHKVKIIAGSSGTYAEGTFLAEQTYNTPLSAPNTYNEAAVVLSPIGDPNGNDTLWLVFENEVTGYEKQMQIDTVAGEILPYPPSFISDSLPQIDAVEIYELNDTLSDHVFSPAFSMLTFSKTSGASWLNVAPDGSLSGVPGGSDIGVNTFAVHVVDAQNFFDDAILNITVLNTYSGMLGLPDFAGLASQWLEMSCGLCGGADLNGDGNVGLGDLEVMAEYWLFEN